jgi:hypothetical protein
MSFNPIQSLVHWLARRARAPEWVRLKKEFGRFPNDRDKAALVGEEIIKRALDESRTVVLDLAGVEVATQSFFHCLLRPALAERPERISRIMVAKGSEPNIAALELALDFLIRDHNRSKSKIQPKVKRFEDFATSH